MLRVSCLGHYGIGYKSKQISKQWDVKENNSSKVGNEYQSWLQVTLAPETS